MGSLIENNRIIATFMGAKFSTQTKFALLPQDCWLPVFGIVRWDKVGVGFGNTIHYHDSWDWIMPVVEHISYLEYVNINITKSQIGKYRMQISYEKHSYNREGNKTIFVEHESYISVVYMACVEFIKWWNLNRV